MFSLATSEPEKGKLQQSQALDILGFGDSAFAVAFFDLQFAAGQHMFARHSQLSRIREMNFRSQTLNIP